MPSTRPRPSARRPAKTSPLKSSASSPLSLRAAPLAHQILEAVVQIALQRLQPLDIALALRQERVEQRFVLARGEEPPLDAEPAHHLDEAEVPVTTPIEPTSEVSSA